MSSSGATSTGPSTAQPAAATPGRLIVISGPSGTGKTSICKALLARLPGSRWSVSATTRPIRPGDVEGESYEFLTAEEFARRHTAGDFLETAEYCGYQYGTPRKAIQEAVDSGSDIVLEIDVQGGRQIAETQPDSIRIFVLPPNMESLRARLEGRKSEAEAQLRKRLAEADGEIAYARDSGVYRHFVVNDELATTIEEVLRIIRSEKGLA
jgi:guanylate kinase